MATSSPQHDRPKSVPRPLPWRETPPPSTPWRDAALNLQEQAQPSELFDPRQLLLMLKRGYRFVLMIALLTFLAVMAITLASRMSFRASGRLYLGEVEGKPEKARQSEEIDLSGGEQSDVWSEVEIITSRGLVSKAILASGLNADISRRGTQPVRYWKWLLTRRDFSLVDAAAQEVTATETQLAAFFRTPQTFRLHFVNDSDYEVWKLNRKLGQGKMGEATSLAELKIKLERGTVRAPRAGAEFDLTVEPMDQVTQRVQKSLDVNVPKALSVGEPVKVVTLEFDEKSPRLAASFLDHLMRAYLEERRSWKTEDATLAEEFVTNQLRQMRGSLEQLEQKLAEYRSTHRAVVLDDEARALIEQVGKYEEQRVAARLQVAALTDIQRTLKDPNPPLGAFLLGEAEDTVLEGMAKSLTKAREDLTDLESRFNDAAPEVRRQRVQVDSQLESVRNYVSSRLLRAKENQATLGGIIGQFENRLKSVPGAEIGLAQLARESEVYSRLYSYLLERQQQMAIVKASNVSNNRVLDVPELPRREASPRLALRLASGPLGLLLGVILLILRRVVAETFQNEDDVRRTVGALPILSAVPFERVPRNRASAWRELDPLSAANSEAFKEAFRTLRTNLYFLRPGEVPRVILLTSAGKGDGKTTCALALAGLLAADGKRVLVVDGDVRNPSHRVSDVATLESNLQDALDGQCDWRTAVHGVRSDFGEFDSLGSSEELSFEYLTSERMSRILEEARAEYDLVLIDSPAFPEGSDAIVLAAASDWVVSVVSLRRASRRLAVEHLRRLALTGRVQAVVVNDVGKVKARSDRSIPLSRPGSSTGRPPMRSVSPKPRLRANIGAQIAGVVVAVVAITAATRIAAGIDLGRNFWRPTVSSLANR